MFKKLMLLAAFALVYAEGFSYPILSRSTSGWGIGYYSTDAHLETISVSDGNGGVVDKLGWVISCSGSAFTHCPDRSNLYSPSTGRPDATDLTSCGNLLDYADVQLNNNVSSGSHTIHVQVVGESFERIYVLTWSINGNGSTTTTIDETDVPNP